MPQVRQLVASNSILVPCYPRSAARTKVRLPPSVAYPRGTLLAERLSQRAIWRQYDPQATDGTQIPRLILEYDCRTDAAGTVTEGTMISGGIGRVVPTASAFCHGFFLTQDLVGLDGPAVAALGRLVEGDVLQGVLELK